MEKIADEIKRLKEEYLTLSESGENKRRLSCWEPEVCARDQWHGRARLEAFRKEGAVPITVDLQNPLWLKLFPQDLTVTYTNPDAYLRFYLQKRVEQFKRFRDDTPLEPLIPIWLHTPFEMSLFGVPVHYYPDKDPLIDMTAPVCRSPEELDALPPVDFFKSGMMPLAHRIYQGILDIAGSEFTVLFPEWGRGPFGVAMYIGGYQKMLFDMATAPDFFHRMMKRVTEERKNYFRNRAAFTGEKEIPPGSLFNDEVDSGVIGPIHYRNFILPYEKELGRFHGRISYWHSCGNSWPMAKDIGEMGYVDKLDISGYTDTEKMVASASGLVSRLDIRFHPVRDLQDASPQWMGTRIRKALEACRRYDVPAVSLRASGMNPWETPEKDFARIAQWISVARRVVSDGKEASP
jgi:hypothetical protein